METIPPREVLVKVFAITKDLYNRIEEDRKGFSLPACIPPINALFNKEDLATAKLSQNINRYGMVGGGEVKVTTVLLPEGETFPVVKDFAPPAQFGGAEGGQGG